MKVVSQDSSALVATDKDYKGLIFGVVFVLVGVGVLIAGHSNTLALLIGLLLALGGLAAVLLRKVRTLEVNLGTGQVTFTMKSLVKSGTKSFAVADIAKVQFFQAYSTTFSGGPRGGGASTSQLTKVLLVAKNGETIDLADGQRSTSSFGIFGSPPNEQTGRKVAEFLGVPFEEVGAPSLAQVAGAVTEAVTGHNNPTSPPSLVPTNSQPQMPTTQPAATPEPGDQPASPPPDSSAPPS